MTQLCFDNVKCHSNLRHIRMKNTSKKFRESAIKIKLIKLFLIKFEQIFQTLVFFISQDVAHKYFFNHGIFSHLFQTKDFLQIH